MFVLFAYSYRTIVYIGPNGGRYCRPEQRVGGFCHQQESAIENRHFRSYIYDDASNVGGSRESGNSSQAARLSYIQFYGPMPVRGRKSFSVGLPVAEKDYVAHVSKLGDTVCPLKLINDPSFPPAVLNASVYGSLNISHRPPTNWAYKYQGASQRPITNSLVPMRWECGYHLRNNRIIRAGIKTVFSEDFPNLYSILKPQFDEEVISPMGVTHSIINIGHHARVYPPADTQNSSWIALRVAAAAGEFEGNKGYASAPEANKLPLPQVNWRTCTAYATFSRGNDGRMRAYSQKLASPESKHKLGLIDVSDLTAQLYEVHNWVIKFGDTLDAQLLDVLISKPSAKDINVDLPGLNETANARRREAAVALTSLRVLVSDRLVSHVAAEMAQSSADSENVHVARKARSGHDVNWGKHVTVKVPVLMADAAHPQPWVYTQLNTAFLNSICPFEGNNTAATS